jgi:hypothetical protein
MSSVFLDEKFSYGLCGAENDLEVCPFKDVCGICVFPTNVCEIGPFLGGVGRCGFVGVVGLCGFIGKDLLWRVLCIMFSSCWYSICCKL